MKSIVPHSKLSGSIALSSLTASVGLIGGLALQLVERDIVNFLPLLVALPAINAMTGDYATITAAHLADPENYRKQTLKLLKALFISLPISSVGVIAISLGIAAQKGEALSMQAAQEFAVHIAVVIYGVTLLIFGAIYVTNKILTYLNVNIDDTLIPIANTLASVVTLLAMTLVAARLV